MPLVRIDLREGTSPDYRIALGDGVQRAMIEALALPPDDRFQVITEHPPEGLIYDRTYLGHPALRQSRLRADHDERRTQAPAKTQTLPAHGRNSGGIPGPEAAGSGDQSRGSRLGKLVLRKRRSSVHGRLTFQLVVRESCRYINSSMNPRATSGGTCGSRCTSGPSFNTGSAALPVGASMRSKNIPLPISSPHSRDFSIAAIHADRAYGGSS